MTVVLDGLGITFRVPGGRNTDAMGTGGAVSSATNPPAEAPHSGAPKVGRGAMSHDGGRTR
jgi:hypothetical protein